MRFTNGLDSVEQALSSTTKYYSPAVILVKEGANEKIVCYSEGEAIDTELEMVGTSLNDVELQVLGDEWSRKTVRASVTKLNGEEGGVTTDKTADGLIALINGEE